MCQNEDDADAHEDEGDGKDAFGFVVVVHEGDEDEAGKADYEEKWDASHDEAN
jgi:hypothetical protein